MADSFIAKINAVYAKLAAIEEASDLFSEDIVSKLEDLADLDIDLIAKDLAKGNYLGNRKIDIDISLNNENTEEEVTYQSATLVLNNGVNVAIPFETTTESGDTVVDETASYTGLYTKILAGINAYNDGEENDQLHVVNYEIDVINQTIADKATMLRIRDTDGSACNIDRVILKVYSGGSPIEQNPAYYWTKTTSALQVLANRVGDIIALGEDIDKIIALSDKEDEIQYLYDVREKLEVLYNAADNINTVGVNINNVNILAGIKDAIIALYDIRDTLSTLNTSIENVNAVGNNIEDVVTVAGLESKMDDVIGNETNINTVAADIANVIKTGEGIEDVGSVASNMTNVVTVANNVDNIGVIAGVIDNVNEVAQNSSNITDVADNIADIQAVRANQTNIDTNAANITAIQNATINAATASSKATEASGYANDAKSYRDELTNLSVTAIQLTSSQTASASYNSATGVLTVGIPQGLKGEKGEAYDPDAVGTLANRALYDAQGEYFSYLATDVSPSTIYFKLSDTSGDWDDGSPFGQGEQGETGATGNGIASIQRTSGDGSAGTTDTYTITFTDLTTTTFTVTNGTANLITSVNSQTGDVVLAKSDVGLGNVDNTSDLAKPISTATQTALDAKAPQSTTYTKTEVDTKLNTKQATLTFDTAPTNGSTNPVTSDGVYDALALKVPTSRTINGKALSADVTITKTDINLGNVDNTSDLAKPISTATQTALDAKLGSSANAVSASKLATARTIAITGAVTGSASFDGSGNISIAASAALSPTITLGGDLTGSATLTNLGSATLTAAVKDDSHNHIISNIDGLQAALDAKISSANVLSSISSASVGAVGTYAFLIPTVYRSAGVSPGATLAGSNLRYANASGSDSSSASTSANVALGSYTLMYQNGAASTTVNCGSSPSGTWKALGYIPTSIQYNSIFGTNMSRATATLWLRIA